MKVRELLSDKSKWTKRWYARTKDGFKTNATSKDAVSFCLLGAIEKCYGTEFFCNLPNDVKGKLYERFGSASKPSSWNDANERTFEEVKTLVDELDI